MSLQSVSLPTVGGSYVLALAPAWPGFGTSDCDCFTHLFYASELPSLGAFKARLARAGCDTGGLAALGTAK